MSLAFDAMPRKYTGDLRKAPAELIEILAGMYVVGLSVTTISERTGLKCAAIRSFVNTRRLKRDPSSFALGVACLAEKDEVFKQVPWAKSYFVSDQGRIVGMTENAPGTLLKPYASPLSGYLTVKLKCDDGSCATQYVHRIVLLTFRGEGGQGSQCAHGDGVKTNNCLSNLRWATVKENAADKDLHGTLLRGSDSPKARIDEAQAGQIKRLLRLGQTHASIALELGVSNAAVSNIAQNKTWKHVPAALSPDGVRLTEVPA